MVTVWTLLALVSWGCGPRAGALWYFMGGGRGEKIKAQFELPNKPLLILVDDDWDLVQPRTARDALVDELATELRRHELVERVTTNEELARIRRAEPDFDKRGAREIGQLANADLVLWLRVVRFSLDDDLEMAYNKAHFAVTVKVLDVHATEREQVRLWPKDPDGELVAIEVGPHEIRKCESITQAHQELASAMAFEVARLFYEYREEE